jgi:ankyrin repeat protein
MCPQGGNTALHLAAEQGHEDAARLLADQEDGAFINFANRVPALLHCCAPRLPC